MDEIDLEVIEKDFHLAALKGICSNLEFIKKEFIEDQSKCSFFEYAANYANMIASKGMAIYLEGKDQ